MTEEQKQPTADEAIAAFVLMRDDLEEKEQRFKQFKAERKEDMKRIADYLGEIIDAQGVESLKGSSGTAFWATIDATPIENYDQFVDSTVADAMHQVYGTNIDSSAIERVAQAMLEVGPLQFMNKAVGKTKIKAYMKEHNDQTPPGVGYSRTREIQVRRPTA